MQSAAKTPDPENPYDPARLFKTWADMFQLSNDIAKTLADKNKNNEWADAPLDPFHLRDAYVGFMDRLMQNPERVTNAQMDLWRNYMNLWDRALTKMTGGEAPDMIQPEKGDRRFKNEAWTQNALFDFIKQSYLLTADWLMKIVDQNTSGLDTNSAKRLAFFTRQYIDALSPTNFAFTNPEVLQATLESGGENLVRGMRNLLDDLKRGHSVPAIRMTDESAFTLGKNIAATQGQVIFRNAMMELIHYAPTGKTTYETPLLIMPPWINKYYILDLKPEFSFVRWALEQGHAVFMISWANPDETMKDVGFDDYMKDGLLAALDAVLKQTGAPSANVIGYCIGGTLLSMSLSYMKAKKKDHLIKSATFLTTLIDFDQAGDLKLFVDEEQLQMISDRMAKKGYLDAEALQVTFNMLRANDLIWSFVINNYLMGREPFPFDLLYWNSDSTNMPAAMHEFYLRRMYLKNDLVKPGSIKIGDVPVDVTTINTPAYFLSTREDHIAPWKATYAGHRLLGGDTTFTLAASGHIAGVANHPAAKKYCFWTRHGKAPESCDKWLENAKQEEGSWWPHWQKWIEKYAGKQVPAINPSKGPLKALEPAPGKYVRVKAR